MISHRRFYPDDSPCPCSSANSYQSCCAPFITGKQYPSVPEKLMRSRYTAYALGDVDYIFSTMREKALSATNRRQVERSMQHVEWLGLNVLEFSAVNEKSTQATVEFIAYYKENGGVRSKLHEKSQFKKYNGRWYYTDSVNNMCARRSSKVSRNEPCPCGSGKKYKKCCYEAR